MAHRFEITQEIEVAASPEQAWEAIATGPGMDSWFMGRSEIEAREGGQVRWSIGGFTLESTVETWDPPKRFVNRGSEGPDGSTHQFDYQIAPREGGGSTLRFVHTGALAGDWETEYEAMTEGDPMYVGKLQEYLTYFIGRLAISVDGEGPVVADSAHVWNTFNAALGLRADAKEGDAVHVTSAGLPPIDGVVDYVSPSFRGIRSDDALYRFIHGFDGRTMVGHHLFGDDVDQHEAERAWRSWLAEIFEG